MLKMDPDFHQDDGGAGASMTRRIRVRRIADFLRMA
jgi:hypothetical protein